MVTFALFILFFSIESKDQRDSAFSLDTFSDKTFVITTIGSFVLLILSTVLSIFQTVMKTVQLDVQQWLICTATALSIVVATEIRKAVLRQTAARAIHPPAAPGRSQLERLRHRYPQWLMPVAAEPRRRRKPAATRSNAPATSRTRRGLGAGRRCRSSR